MLDRSSRVNISILEVNTFLRNNVDFHGDDIAARAAQDALEAAERAKVTTWWSAQSSGRANFVPQPAAFDVTVAPGDYLQAAVDRCPPGGSVLLLPGLHPGSLLLTKDVHVFGRGAAEIRSSNSAHVIVSVAPDAVIDGLILRSQPDLGHESPTIADLAVGLAERNWNTCTCVEVVGGRLRMQACHIDRAIGDGVQVTARAEVEIVACQCAGGRRGRASSSLASSID